MSAAVPCSSRGPCVDALSISLYLSVSSALRPVPALSAAVHLYPGFSSRMSLSLAPLVVKSWGVVMFNPPPPGMRSGIGPPGALQTGHHVCCGGLALYLYRQETLQPYPWRNLRGQVRGWNRGVL